MKGEGRSFLAIREKSCQGGWKQALEEAGLRLQVLFMDGLNYEGVSCPR